MSIFSRTVLSAGLALMLVGAIRMTASSPGAADVREIEAFNLKFEEVTLRMDNAGVMAPWAEDGVTLLSGMAPMVGKRTITTWLDYLVAKMPGYRVTKEENEFHDIQVPGDWASEWGVTFHLVQPPDGKPPIESHGKILLVLHKEKDGVWRIKQEMWNAGVQP
jgi:ketosteroid isomerase-like protein